MGIHNFLQGPPPPYRGWTKCISHHCEPMVETIVCWYLQGIIRNQSFLGSAKWISQPSTVFISLGWISPPILVGIGASGWIGMFTGGTICVLTHGHTVDGRNPAPPQEPWNEAIPQRKYQQTSWFQPWFRSDAGLRGSVLIRWGGYGCGSKPMVPSWFVGEVATHF